MTAPAHDDAHATARDAAFWIETLLRQHPELLTELAPSRRSPSTPGPRRGGSGARASGGTAPLRLHVSDTIRDITDGVVELDEAVHDRLRLPRPRRAQVPQRLTRVAGLLDHAGGDPVLVTHIRDEARRMARRCSRALGEAEPVVRVEGRCPWCDSVSLRAFPARRSVLCVNPACHCGDELCDCRTDPAYRHAWPEEEWTR
ncbi:hypothetical protein [Streptomyces sp. TRM49041]|uniref:hypothetical protein n=1 Tax=Streptomyces sp. TRM49041 TaxID=2603216 RepID=UPI0011EE5931|nr:hypothetical protein [Streptomyces sp. TRM49041]